MKAHQLIFVYLMGIAMFYFGFQVGRSEKYEAQFSKIVDDIRDVLKKVQIKELRWQNTISDT